MIFYEHARVQLTAVAGVRSEVAIKAIRARLRSPEWLKNEVTATREGLMRLRQNVLLLRDPDDPDSFYPVRAGPRGPPAVPYTLYHHIAQLGCCCKTQMTLKASTRCDLNPNTRMMCPVPKQNLTLQASMALSSDLTDSSIGLEAGRRQQLAGYTYRALNSSDD